MNRLLLAGVAGAVVLAGLSAIALAPRMTGDGAVQIGGPFTLVEGSGKTVTDRDFRGKFMLVYFGYTHCPDACPTTLGDIAAMLDILPAVDHARLVPVFITVDPQRDTPAVIAGYAHAFGPEFVGLTGSAAQISDVEQLYHVYAQKTPLKNGDYAMDHSSVLYLMGRAGTFVSVLDDGGTPKELAARLRALGV